jgi:hypothetical protein
VPGTSYQHMLRDLPNPTGDCSPATWQVALKKCGKTQESRSFSDIPKLSRCSLQRSRKRRLRFERRDAPILLFYSHVSISVLRKMHKSEIVMTQMCKLTRKIESLAFAILHSSMHIHFVKNCTNELPAGIADCFRGAHHCISRGHAAFNNHDYTVDNRRQRW